MTVTTLTRCALAALATGALAAPVAAEANGGHGKGHDRSPAGAEPGESKGTGKGRHKARKNPTVTYTFKGRVVSVDVAAGTAVVKVASANHHGRAARRAEVTFDLTAAKVTVADVNADGVANLADVAAGDRVLVQARLPKRGAKLTQAVVARKLVDRSHGETDTAGSDDAPDTGAGWRP